MSWTDEWRSTANRIQVLNQIALALAQSLQSLEHISEAVNPSVADDMLNRPLLDLNSELVAMRDREIVPQNVRDRLRHLLEVGARFAQHPKGIRGAVLLSTSLMTICTQLDPYMRDDESPRIHIAERAFLHLQRLIVADSDVGAQWQAAFAKGEVLCERLGGAHLLHHGIYAIKSNAAGERTDLILGTRLAITPKIQRSADAMALTEWKLVRDPAVLDEVVDQARRQAMRYPSGSLAGFEISSMRYLVTVSEDVIDEKDDEVVGAVTYRHVNIAVNPSTPSRS